MNLIDSITGVLQKWKATNNAAHVLVVDGTGAAISGANPLPISGTFAAADLQYDGTPVTDDDPLPVKIQDLPITVDATVTVAPEIEIKNDTGNPVGVTGAVVKADDDVYLALDDLDHSLVYNGDGTLNYIQVSSGGTDYRQTFGYTSGDVTSISKWTAQ